jgi:hypothetical protein
MQITDFAGLVAHPQNINKTLKNIQSETTLNVMRSVIRCWEALSDSPDYSRGRCIDLFGVPSPIGSHPRVDHYGAGRKKNKIQGI